MAINFTFYCPICLGGNTKIRTSKKVLANFRIVYCDCLDPECVTRFKVEFGSGSVIHTLNQKLTPSET